MLTDPTRNVKDWHIMNDHCVLVEWEYKACFTPEPKTTNIFIAIFTSTWGRLALYDLLDLLQEAVVYTDTDSIIYISEAGRPDPPLGVFLGELTDELDGRYIIEYVATAPKCYAFLLSDNTTCCKIKGFSLNHEPSSKLNFQALCDKVFFLAFWTRKQSRNGIEC